MVEGPADPLLQLVGLSRRARRAASAEELAFMVVNDSRALCAYRQAALWRAEGGLKALSGVVEPEANAPYAQWLAALCRHLHDTHREAAAVAAVQLPAALASEWADWLPPHGLWLPFHGGGLLLAADAPWADDTTAVLQEWVETWHHAWTARTATQAWRPLRERLAGWRRRRTALAVAALVVLALPVRLSVLAPGELVPAQAAIVRAPLDGVIGQFHVQPNQVVKAGQPLFGFDEAAIAARQEVAVQALAAAEAEYRQSVQQAVSDVRSKAQLAGLLGRIEEKRAEADYLREQFNRSRVTAPQDGTALFDDASEWVGKPVQMGERILRIAAPGDVEVEAWLPIGDAIPLAAEASVSLYLATDPLAPLEARVRYVAHDAVLRPDGSYAYRLRARLDGATDRRVGLKGTVKINGERVPLAYWLLRRPLAATRQALGL